MYRLLLSLSCIALLAGCDKPVGNDLPNNQPDPQIAEEKIMDQPLPIQQPPSDATAPVTEITTEFPEMPRTSRTPADPTPQHGSDGVKSNEDLQATMSTPTNQTVVSSVDKPAGSGNQSENGSAPATGQPESNQTGK